MPLEPDRIVSSPAVTIRGRPAIEDYLARLNLASPVAERRIVAWGPAGDEGLHLSTVPQPATAAEPGTTLTECRIGFALELRTCRPDAAPRGPVVGLLLAGSMTVSMGRHDIMVHAGEGVIVEPAAVDRSRLAPGTCFVEFSLPGAPLSRLCRDWAPGLDRQLPIFAPKIGTPLAQKLSFIAAQAAGVLQARPPPGTALAAKAADLADRWTEMLMLTLLSEQPVENMMAPPRRADHRGPAPASVRRAIEFMHAHADGAIGLVDIAGATCTSPRSVLRHFTAYVGMTPAAYLRGIRLDRARHELRAGRGPIRDIALRWGFQNASKFSRAYASRFGEAPSKDRAAW